MTPALQLQRTQRFPTKLWVDKYFARWGQTKDVAPPRPSATVSSLETATKKNKKKTENKGMSPEKEAFYTNFILIIRIETSLFRGDMLTMLVFRSVFFPKNMKKHQNWKLWKKMSACGNGQDSKPSSLHVRSKVQPEICWESREIQKCHGCDVSPILPWTNFDKTSALGLCWSGETLRNANSKQLLHESARYVVKWIGRFCAWMTSQLLWLLVANISELGSHRTIDKVHIIALGLCKPQPHVF